MTGDASSPVVVESSGGGGDPPGANMHFRPHGEEPHGGEDSPELHHPVGHPTPEEEDASPSALRLGRFKAYHYAAAAVQATSSGGAFGDPLGPEGNPHPYSHGEPPLAERRYRSPSGETADIDYIRSQYSPPGGEWSGNMSGGPQVSYLEHSPRGVCGGGLLVPWNDQTPKFNPPPRTWSDDPHQGLHHGVHHHPGPSGAGLPPCGPPHLRRGHPRQLQQPGPPHHHPEAPPHSGGSTTTSTSSLNDSIPDDTLAVLSVKELNKRVQNLAREDVVLLKQRRRTLKNRGYAMNCRMRRQQHKESLEVELDNMKKEKLQLVNERDFYKNQLKNCRCHANHGNDSSLELPPGGGPPVSYSHHAHHHHPLVSVHPQQLDLSLNHPPGHEDYKRIYPPGHHDLKVQPNMNFVF